MNESFITKLQTEHYLIGSFDAYEDASKNLIKANSKLLDEEANAILQSMPTSYRAAIINKTGDYIGYIGLFNVDAQNNISSLRLEVKDNLSQDDKNEILKEFRKYIFDDLNITDIDKFIYITKNHTEIEKKEITPKSNIFIPSRFLVPGITMETLERFSEDYDIPKLQMPFTIKSGDWVIGIIGLSNIIWPNRRATLNIFLDKSIGSDITSELSGYIIDDYINYVHSSNIHNITLSVKGSNQEMIDILNNTSMNYYGQIPYGAISGDNIESNLMFQHIPNMKKDSGIILPTNKSISISLIDTDKKEMASQIQLANGFRLVSPKRFEELGINFNTILDEHIKVMQNREGFSIPLGEDKFFLQKGNGNYGLSKTLMNYTYVILDENNNYSGYINILRTNAGGKNAEVEIGIVPKLQRRGLGTMIINRFYDEVFQAGYASATSVVFEFNTPSLKLHEKVAELNGTRLESYYINGKLWDMNYYTRINDTINEEGTRHI